VKTGNEYQDPSEKLLTRNYSKLCKKENCPDFSIKIQFLPRCKHSTPRLYKNQLPLGSDIVTVCSETVRTLCCAVRAECRAVECSTRRYIQ